MDLIREPGRDIARGEAVEAGLDAMIVRRNDWPVAEEGDTQATLEAAVFSIYPSPWPEREGPRRPLVRVDYEGRIPLIRRCRIPDLIS